MILHHKVLIIFLKNRSLNTFRVEIIEEEHADYLIVCYTHFCYIIKKQKGFTMRKKLTTFLLIVSIIFSFFPSQAVYAENTSSELNIYAMYLPGSEKGDSVLLESKGNYLLIDMGTSSHVTSIIKQLLEIGATDIDVMFSHLHKDHMGASSDNILAGLKQLEAANIHVSTLYLADPSLSPYSINNQRRYLRLQDYFNSLDNSRIVYLNVGDHISIGDTDGQIIGPLNTSSFLPQKYAITPGSELTATGSSIYTYYENNCSLAAIFTCGSTRYFTAGDCMSDEANYLLQRYGSQLKCDIMKLSHHGISSGNSSELLNAIQPTYSFASNSSFTSINSETGRWRTYASASRATKYGMCYLPATQKKTMIYHIRNDVITLYQGTSVSSKNKVKKWISVYGEDGTKRDHNMYYFVDGQPLTGIQYIDGHYFNFDETGRMEYGKFSSLTGKYLGWKTYNEGRRFYRFSKDKKFAYMAKGFTDIGGEKYYFRSNGFKMVNGTNEILFKHIGSNYYAITPSDTFLYDEWYNVTKTAISNNNSDSNVDSANNDTDAETEEIVNSYYFDINGKMARNCIKEIDDEYYLFSSNGILVRPKADAEFELVDFKNKTYAVYEDGTLLTDQIQSINGADYYFDKHGAMQKSIMLKVDGHTYYFGKSGKLIRNRYIKWKGQKYYCKPSGIVKKIKASKK